jgi:thioredoxin-dependent peroxiredoxin
VAVEVGSAVPNFLAHSSSGADIKLSDLAGKKVVLYFYPKDDTPGCTLEGNDFNRLRDQFKAMNAVVFGVSRDSVNSHCKFISKYGFKFELLSDDQENLCRLFDVIKEKNMYGKKVMGIERSTFIIDENSKLIAEYRKVKADGHAQAVLEHLKSL